MICSSVEIPQADPKKAVVSFEDEAKTSIMKRERLRTWKNYTVSQAMSDLRPREEEDTHVHSLRTFLPFIPPGATDYVVTNIQGRS